MTNSSYPALLNKRAKILASLNRTDLLTLALSYLVLSKLKISVLLSFALIVAILLIKKSVETKIEKSFFLHLFSKRIVKNWRLK